MISKVINIAIGSFVSDISTLDGQIFPLRFLKRDLDNNTNTLHRDIGDDTLSRIIRKLELADEQYDTLGFGKVTKGLLLSIEIQELAVIQCLRYLFPFKPEAAKNIKASKRFVFQYLQCDDSSEVCFPDHMCGPDIIYKCTKTKTIYIVQVKFVKRMSKQETANACDTTDPNLFYCKRKGNRVLKGFEHERTKLLESLRALQEQGFCFLFILEETRHLLHRVPL
ncbi:hypothetical protein BC833DRAFT_566095 [Globomyces pollinis-pini]|nr:hypothetical protein BC833DRAFT_566095 [Globomyces pollinis-pini]